MFWCVFLGAFPFGGLLGGLLADHYGEPPVLLGAGVMVVLGLLFFGGVLLRAVRAESGSRAASGATSAAS